MQRHDFRRALTEINYTTRDLTLIFNKHTHNHLSLTLKH